MFSQFIHILNIWTILLSTVGIASYSHYCQDELKTISFFVDTTKPCCKKQKLSVLLRFLQEQGLAVPTLLKQILVTRVVLVNKKAKKHL